MNNVLLYIGGVLVVVLAALFAVPHFVDWNGYRGVFEEVASRVIGREVRVGGAVNVRLLPAPYVRFEKVRVADSTGGTGEPFFRADSFTLWLSVPPLLKGVLEANEIELKRPQLRLNIDEQGRGSWNSLTMSQGSLPFAPAGVTLQAVRVTDGGIVVSSALGGEVLRLDGFNGELEAESLDGPYKLRGNTMWRGAERDIRLNTARADSDGGIRIKAIVAAPRSGNSYVLDGRLSDVRSQMRFDGTVQGKMQLDAAPGLVAESAGKANERPFIELKSMVAANLEAARLAEITISVENMGQPQLVTGDARVAWGQSSETELALAARWLDLDRLAQATRGVADAPIETAQALVSTLLGQLPASGLVDARFNVEQLNLGGDVVAGLSLKLARGAGPLEIKELRAGLPGGARVDLMGVLTDGKALPELNGPLLLRGSSVNRFLAWAGKGAALGDARSDGQFLVRGQLKLSETALELTEADAELQGIPLKGEIRHEHNDRRRISMTLDGQRVNLAQLWPGGPEWLASLLPSGDGVVASGQAATPAGSQNGSQARASAETNPSGAQRRTMFDLANTDLSLRIRVADLAVGTLNYSDVDGRISIERGKLTIPSMRLITSDGLEVDIEGELSDALTAPRGTLRGLVATDRPAGAAALFKALSGGEHVDVAAEQLAALAPLRLAGRVSLGNRGAASTDIEADGLVQGGRFVGKARLDGGWMLWREGVADLAVTADSPDVDQLLRLALGAKGGAQRGRAPRRGVLSFNARGVPNKGMLTTATVESPGLVLTYDGPLKLEKGIPAAIEGDVRVAADQIDEALALVGINLGASVAGVPVDGVLHVSANDNVVTLKPRELLIGASKVSGYLILAQRADQPSTVTAQLDVGDVTLDQLLSPLLDRRLAPGEFSAARRVSAGSDGLPWPDRAFDLVPLDRLEGHIGLRAKRFILDDGIAIQGARLNVALAPGRLIIETLEGSALGGLATANAAISKSPGGFDFKGSLKLAGLKPSVFVDVGGEASGGGEAKGGLVEKKGGAEAASTGAVSVMLELTSRALSPRSVVAAMKGQGEVEISGLEITGLTPRAVARAALDVVEGKIEPGDGALTRALVMAIEKGAAKLTSTKLPVEVRDGAMRLKPIVVEAQGGRTTIDTTIDLSSLRIDSEWRVEQASTPRLAGSPSPAGQQTSQVSPQVRASGPFKSPLPAVYLVYTGPLKDVVKLEPRISAGALERELSVRKMEHEVEQLERLRAEDERRRAEEAARLRAVEEERARAALVPSFKPAPGDPAGEAIQGGAPPKTQPVPGVGVPVSTSPQAPLPQGSAATAPPGSGLAGGSSGATNSPDGAAKTIEVTPLPPVPAAADRSGLTRSPPAPRPARRPSKADDPPYQKLSPF